MYTPPPNYGLVDTLEAAAMTGKEMLQAMKYEVIGQSE